MKKLKVAVIILLMMLGFGGLAACSNSSTDQQAASELTQDKVYNYLQEAQYTGLSKFNQTFEGLDDA
ncbi:hypothetical protein [Lactococcus termiticola]|uniref:Uncharacterized protein n=1 Tax=Lactococcus termiticola TaxID=2169526 RepID=A0A2R5HDP7_9LACT|nr:hypothetical protein [Lactococcus termiticola]GBG96183.1 hypothetical protein NtB2_00294 [Lactococcus termiticola]